MRFQGRKPVVRRSTLKQSTKEAPTPKLSFTTQVFASHVDWMMAGRPTGGVFPVGADRSSSAEAWPERYLSTEAYYVALPTGQLWCPWQKAYNHEKGGYYGDGWKVDGSPEKLTAWPSIQVDGWHGYLTDGVLHPVRDE